MPELSEKRDKYLAIMREQADIDDYSKCLKFLSECLKNYFGKKAVIPIDEYDVPLESSYVNGYYDEMIDFIRSLFESALKTNPCLEFAVLTGCLRISKESVFAGMNNLEIISILNKNYDEYFGFTETDVKQICKDYDLSSKLGTIRKWYNGYVFGDVNVYNPWSFARELTDDGYESIVRYGIAFYRKDCEVRVEGQTSP